MSFMYPYVLALLLLIPFLWMFVKKDRDDLKNYFTSELYKKMVAKNSGLNKRSRKIILLISLAFVIIALARPNIDNGAIKIKRRVANLVVAFDISRSMFANDVYPNRFELAKRKFSSLLDSLKNSQVGVIAFSSKAFLVSPLSDDYLSLKYLVNHIGFDFVSLRGTNFMAPLEITDNLLKNSNQKALLIFTDGGDQIDFKKEIAYAKTHNIKVFIYAIGTKKGGIMKIGNSVVRDRDGNIVITRLNPIIESLAKDSGGVYEEFSFSQNDMRELANVIEKRVNSSKVKESVIRDRIELFEIPLAIAMTLFLVSFSSLPKRDKK